MKTFYRPFVLWSIVLCAANIAALPARAEQVIGAISVAPASVPAGVATAVKVTAVIDDSSLIAPSVNLQRLDGAGRVVATLVPLVDDGTNGDAVAGDRTFTAQITIFEPNPGPVRLRISAAFLGKLTRALSALTVNVTGSASGIAITSPGNLEYLNTSPVRVTGTLGDPTAQVSVNGVAATVTTGTFTASVPVQEGTNTLTTVATNGGGTTATASIQITLDTTPPHVTITSPSEGYSTASATIGITGIVNDIVVGTVNDQQAQVDVNSVAAQVSNRSFLASSVPLAMGPNTIRATARDRSGNVAIATILVTRSAVTVPTISIASGNGQSGPVGTVLSQPLVARVTDAVGQPAAGVPVVFHVTENSGGLVAGSATLGSFAVTTNAQGQASVPFQLGTRAGVGNNIVEASATGFEGAAIFTSSAVAAPPAQIVVDTGNGQIGVVGQGLPLPFIAIVTDAAHNRLGAVPVTFAVRQGGGSFGGQTTLTTATDSDGRVAAALALGRQEGQDNNVIEATFGGNPGPPAAFVASGRVPGNPADTRITGVVQDNSNHAIPGVTMRLFRTHQGPGIPEQVATAVVSDAQGQFTMLPVPVGTFKLMADGSTAPNGPWPSIEFDITTVSGQANDVGLPIYLPALDSVNRLCVTATTGGTLTLPYVPGFSLTIAPGAATFPGGARSGCVTVTPVNGDKMPMQPGFGQQPRFLVTIQPVGTIFNPPAAITLPNVDGLAPRAVTEMYSYDHDLAAFVAIGTGTVSEDGAVIASDPGVGVLKAGWHCGGNPNPTGSAGTCPECKKCVGTDCVTNPVATTCDSGRGCCLNGACTPLPSGTVPTSLAAPAYVENIIAPDGDPWGVTKERELTVDITPYYDAGSNSWKSKVTQANIRYTIWYRLLAGVQEADPALATTEATYCTMRTDLATLGYPPGRQPQYYMVSAVEAHERMHVVEMGEAFSPEFAPMKNTIESLSVPFRCGSAADQAKAQLKNAAFTQAVTTAFNNFRTRYYGPGFPDPSARTDAAEHAVVDPVVVRLDQIAALRGWQCR